MIHILFFGFVIFTVECAGGGMVVLEERRLLVSRGDVEAYHLVTLDKPLVNLPQQNQTNFVL